MGRSIGFVAGGIGDQIYHLTQLRALAGISQTGTIDIACITPGPMSRILAATPWVGRVVDARPIRRYLPGMRGSAAVRALRLHRYDSAFILHRSTSFKLAAAFAGIPFRAGLADSWLDRLLLQAPLALSSGGARRSVWGHRPFIAAIDEYLVDLGLVLDEDTPTILPDRSATSQAKAFVEGLAGPVVVINLFVQGEGRRWPIDAAIDTLAELAETTGGTFILNAGPTRPNITARLSWPGMSGARKTGASRRDSLSTALALTPPWSGTSRSIIWRTPISGSIPSRRIWR